jgi:membrane protein insertase Oxa1/YidC/SpoIIIJ
MEGLYKQNNFHPFNFFLPALLQAPFFASVFFYLNSAGFKADVGTDSGFLFVRSLTEATSAHTTTLLGLVGLYIGVQLLMMLVQNKFRPDKKTLLLGLGLPALITLFLVHFPAALMLYWTAGMVGLLVQTVLMQFFTPEVEIIHWEPTAKQIAAKNKRDLEQPLKTRKIVGSAVDTKAAPEEKLDPLAKVVADVQAEIAVAKKPHPRSKKRKHGRHRR